MRKIKPFFSIVTCTLNSDKFILKNITSVKRQSFKNYEHVFVDGGSEDNTKELLSFYKNEVGNKVKIINYSEKGISKAFNRGIDISKGEYIIFLNSDDYFFDKKVLQDSFNFLSLHKKLDWIYGKINVIEKNGKTIGVFPIRKIFQSANQNLLKVINYIPHQSVFMKKTVFDKFGKFDPVLKLNMDLDLFLRLSTKTNWRFFDRIVSNYVLRSDSLSSNFRNIELGLTTLERVQSRYLSKKELFFTKITNRLIAVFNRTYRK